MALSVTVFSGHTPPPALGDLVAKIRQLTLLIHVRHSQKGTERELLCSLRRGQQPQREALGDPELRLHGRATSAAEEYERLVVRFFDAAL